MLDNIFVKGIIEKLQYLKELGVDAIWITPFYASPMVDLGYDISDFTAVDPVFGTMADYDVLQAKCKEMGKKIVEKVCYNFSGGFTNIIL